MAVFGVELVNRVVGLSAPAGYIVAGSLADAQKVATVLWGPYKDYDVYASDLTIEQAVKLGNVYAQLGNHYENITIGHAVPTYAEDQAYWVALRDGGTLLVEGHRYWLGSIHGTFHKDRWGNIFLSGNFFVYQANTVYRNCEVI